MYVNVPSGLPSVSMVTRKSRVNAENTVVQVGLSGASGAEVEPHLFDPESDLDAGEKASCLISYQ